MTEEGPSKLEIQQVFKRLKSVSANKVCFDCNAKNPTWSSVTYGVFICMDCSAVHRSLGVHLTFVRSTQLDTNWSWVQIRHMQLGGNANAQIFFNQHNCRTTDAQQKYNSRAAQLYREKLHSMAVQSMRTYGTTLHIGASSANEPHSPDAAEKQVDFFEEHTNGSSTGSQLSEEQDRDAFFGSSRLPEPVKKEESGDDSSAKSAGPSVDAILSSSPTKVAPIKKSTIGARKPAAKKPGLGGKKGGMGAQKVRTDFAELEKEAELADQIMFESKNKKPEEPKKSPEEDAATKREEMASMKLAYEALSKEQDRARQTLDPQKAEQAERLGMGYGGFGAPSSGVSHSVFSQMKTIEQERPSGGASSKKPPKAKDFFSMDSDNDDDDGFDDLGFGLSSSSRSKSKAASSSSSFFSEQLGEDFGSGDKKKPAKASWEKDLEARTGAMKLSSGYTDSSEPAPSPARSFGATATPASTEDTLKKFANAKSISSDQFFGGREQTYEEKTNLARFEGSSAISSDAYFGREQPQSTRRGYAAAGYGMATPDLDDVKESVRQGVTKVAGRLSNIASGVMQQIQEGAPCEVGKMSEIKAEELKKYVKEYPGFPKPGIVFLDIFPILENAAAFKLLIDCCMEQLEKLSPRPDVIFGIESRGFLVAPILAQKLGIAFAPVRKKGKLPGPTEQLEYDLEYGSDIVEVQKHSVQAGQNVVIFDDLLATGGTMGAACNLLKRVGANVTMCLLIIELVDLKGREKIPAPVMALMEY